MLVLLILLRFRLWTRHGIGLSKKKQGESSPCLCGNILCLSVPDIDVAFFVA